ncbi:serine/threonine-protein kinase PCRK1-like [Bidens hawaiensis]|uniref:serine/threonine-protein kinase PCRK1-like n=1 Tax=Bidens hawaiensis TaxID=980011 RepID=UPI00404941F8
MSCFHFTKSDDENAVVSRSSARVSWARSLSVASSSVDTTRRSEFDSDCTDSAGFMEVLTQRRGNELRVFKFSELKLATKGFNRTLMIGEGGFGCVYRGVIKVGGDDGDEYLDVAIKQLDRNGFQASFQGHKEWINEVNFLGVVNHPNLVKLVGYCAEDDERGIQRLLVYELMTNKSLENHLLGRGKSPLSWLTRLKIAEGAARGLAYLHEEMDFQLIFRDFKTSNILLDEDFTPKLSDFGLARQGPAAGLTHVSTVVVGTVGYAAPEYVQTGRLTSKSDVWSFGVVLYELITGRRAVERNLPRNEQKLLEWVKPYISDSKKFHLIIDPRLEGDYSIKSSHKLASLANKCLTKNPKSRPKMSEVVVMLGNIIDDMLPCQQEPETQTETETQVVDENEDGPGQIDLVKEEGCGGGNYMRRVFEFKELVSLRNRSCGRLDWRYWTHGSH